MHMHMMHMHMHMHMCMQWYMQWYIIQAVHICSVLMQCTCLDQGVGDQP